MVALSILALLGGGLLGVGCGSDSPTSPTATVLASFSDPAGGGSTTDVRDVDGDVVRFDLNTADLIWVASGARFSGFAVSGSFLDSAHQFEVRFGTEAGQRRAYFTEAATGTLCDLSVGGGQLHVAATTVAVPN